MQKNTLGTEDERCEDDPIGLNRLYESSASSTSQPCSSRHFSVKCSRQPRNFEEQRADLYPDVDIVELRPFTQMERRLFAISFFEIFLTTSSATTPLRDANAMQPSTNVLIEIDMSPTSQSVSPTSERVTGYYHTVHPRLIRTIVHVSFDIQGPRLHSSRVMDTAT